MILSEQWLPTQFKGQDRLIKSMKAFRRRTIMRKKMTRALQARLETMTLKITRRKKRKKRKKMRKRMTIKLMMLTKLRSIALGLRASM